VAMSLAGIAPLLLVLTGLWVWLRKRPGERLAAEHQRARSAARAGTKSGV